MSEEKIIFKCIMTSSAKDLSEAIKVIARKRIIIGKTLMSLGLVLVAICFIWGLMYSEDLLLIESIGVFLSSKLLVSVYILGILFIWKVVEIKHWIAVKIISIKRKNLKKPSFYISFYETFYEVPSFEENTKTYSRVRINYSDITNFFSTENLYILCIFKSKAEKSLAVMRKDSFTEGTEQDFMKFIQSKVNI